ncbi:hypothetical protein RSSM_02854 [Rhodopirellula sallentina SM41]|uniref:Uncharacterized protein n=1 Tax=Rhodopirellula sallentina SM41 TaxID=1263870 RepID=M5UCY7_9BACT|nr:hypothetical protein RSSM_02854 [Rhodopirellula sallentina SM41]
MQRSAIPIGKPMDCESSNGNRKHTTQGHPSEGENRCPALHRLNPTARANKPPLHGKHKLYADVHIY